ncbi:MAG: polysaccharide pyruvyl transferase family protein [Thermoleophilia bacterium]
MPPAGPGSLGDAAILAGLARALTDRGAAAVTAPPHAPPPGVDAVIVAGADIMDGFYGPGPVEERVDLLIAAHRRGLPTAVAGASLNRAPHPAALAALRRLPAATALRFRDAPSARRARALLGRPVELVADPAFLLAAEPPAPRLAGWVAGHRSAGRTVIGLNANGLLARLQPGLDSVSAHAALAAALSRRLGAAAVVLIPHDLRPGSDDLALARGITGSLPGEVDVAVCDDPSAARAKGLCALLDLVVTGRLHLAIAATGAGTPVMCMDYQDKVAALGPAPHRFAPAELRRPARLAERITREVGRPRAAAPAIPGLEALARANVGPWPEPPESAVPREPLRDGERRVGTRNG